MGIRRYVDAFRRGLRRPEVRHHPIQAITRRIAWRLHWRLSPGTPVILDPWWRNLKIALPHTSNAALVFYRTHSDESVAWALQALLSPRMTFLDVGAHIGAFTLVGAEMVGPEGRVFAIEPLPRCAEAIRSNAAMNAMAQVKVFTGALCDYSGKVGFQSDPKQSAGWIAARAEQRAFETQCWTLDDFLPTAGISKVDVIKLDASGNELGVLQGGTNALRRGAVGALVMKLYHPNVTQERFSYDSRDSLRLLQDWGFRLKLVLGQEAFPLFSPDDANGHLNRLVYSLALVATK